MTLKSERPTYVYFLHGRGGRLLYVGVSHNLPQRRSEHRLSPWFAKVRSWRLVGPFPCRADALNYEREQIRALDPPCNTLYTPRMNALSARRRGAWS